MSAITTIDTFCTGKRAFKSYDEASRAASKTARKGARCRPYKCTTCGLYHYGQAYRPKGEGVRSLRNRYRRNEND